MTIERIAEKPKTISLVPTWRAAAQIFIMALENGTEEGKRHAREGILEMAGKLDELNNELKRKLES